ncbi:MAG: extracellular solute-binding protein [Oscillospiraceae bacterium]|nr:extracellular solute-binding protein [Oscillospiraceae bacterium]
MKKVILVLAILIAIGLVVWAVMNGCGDSEAAGVHEYDYRFATVPFPISTQDVIGEDVTLRYWFGVQLMNEQTTNNTGIGRFMETYQELTGVDFEIINSSPDAGARMQQFTSMLAARDIPDIMDFQWGDPNFVPTGPDAQITAGNILALNEFMHAAPNLQRYMNENPDIARQLATYSGNLYVFPFLRDDYETRTFFGPIVRGDWLRELNMEVPQTLDEWEVMLEAFKTEMGAEVPLSFNWAAIEIHNNFIGAYDVGFGFYVVDGEVKFGQIQPQFYDFLVRMNRWFENGWLDNNIANFDGPTMTANITTGNTGAALGAQGGSIGAWMNLMRDSEEFPDFQVIGVPNPGLNRGDLPMFNGITGIFGGSGAAIGGTTRFPTLATRVLDFFWSPEGQTLASFGTEGLTFTMVDGRPVYTDYVINHVDGMGAVLGRETRATFGPIVQDPWYIEQFAAMPEQSEARRVWSQSGSADHLLPHLMRTAEEEARFITIRNLVNEHASIEVMRFIAGHRPLSEFEDFVEMLINLGANEMVEIQQAAFNRYMAQ